MGLSSKQIEYDESRDVYYVKIPVDSSIDLSESDEKLEQIGGMILYEDNEKYLIFEEENREEAERVKKFVSRLIGTG